MTGFDPAELARLAGEATPGEWYPLTSGVEHGDHWSVCAAHNHVAVAHIHANDGQDEDLRRPDAEFIAYVGTRRAAIVAALTRAQETEKVIEKLRRLVLCNEEVPGSYADAMADVWRCLPSDERRPVVGRINEAGYEPCNWYVDDGVDVRFFVERSDAIQYAKDCAR